MLPFSSFLFVYVNFILFTNFAHSKDEKNVFDVLFDNIFVL